jgi:hypothetical protein
MYEYLATVLRVVDGDTRLFAAEVESSVAWNTQGHIPLCIKAERAVVATDAVSQLVRVGVVVSPFRSLTAATDAQMTARLSSLSDDAIMGCGVFDRLAAPLRIAVTGYVFALHARCRAVRTRATAHWADWWTSGPTPVVWSRYSIPRFAGLNAMSQHPSSDRAQPAFSLLRYFAKGKPAGFVGLTHPFGILV